MTIKAIDEVVFICRNSNCNNIYEDETSVCELCDSNDVEEVNKDELL